MPNKHQGKNQQKQKQKESSRNSQITNQIQVSNINKIVPKLNQNAKKITANGPKLLLQDYNLEQYYANKSYSPNPFMLSKLSPEQLDKVYRLAKGRLKQIPIHPIQNDYIPPDMITICCQDSFNTQSAFQVVNKPTHHSYANLTNDLLQTIRQKLQNKNRNLPQSDAVLYDKIVSLYQPEEDRQNETPNVDPHMKFLMPKRSDMVSDHQNSESVNKPKVENSQQNASKAISRSKDDHLNVSTTNISSSAFKTLPITKQDNSNDQKTTEATKQILAVPSNNQKADSDSKSMKHVNIGKSLHEDDCCNQINMDKSKENLTIITEEVKKEPIEFEHFHKDLGLLKQNTSDHADKVLNKKVCHSHSHHHQQKSLKEACQHISATKIGCFSIIHDHRRDDCVHDCIHPKHDLKSSHDKEQKNTKVKSPKINNGLKSALNFLLGEIFKQERNIREDILTSCLQSIQKELRKMYQSDTEHDHEHAHLHFQHEARSYQDQLQCIQQLEHIDCCLQANQKAKSERNFKDTKDDYELHDCVHDCCSRRSHEHEHHPKETIVTKDQDLEKRKKHVCQRLISSFTDQIGEIQKKIEIQNDNINDIRRTQNENLMKQKQEASKIYQISQNFQNNNLIIQNSQNIVQPPFLQQQENDNEIVEELLQLRQQKQQYDQSKIVIISIYKIIQHLKRNKNIFNNRDRHSRFRKKITTLQSSEQFHKLFIVERKRYLDKISSQKFPKYTRQFIWNSVMIIRECIISIMQDKFINAVYLDNKFDPEDISTLCPNQLEDLLKQWKLSLKLLRSKLRQQGLELQSEIKSKLTETNLKTVFQMQSHKFSQFLQSFKSDNQMKSFDGNNLLNEMKEQWTQFSATYPLNFGELGSLILNDFKENPSTDNPLKLDETNELKQIIAMLAYQQQSHQQDEDMSYYLSKLQCIQNNMSDNLMKVLIDNFNPTFPMLSNTRIMEYNVDDDMEHNPLKHLVYVDDDMQYLIENCSVNDNSDNITNQLPNASSNNVREQSQISHAQQIHQRNTDFRQQEQVDQSYRQRSQQSDLIEENENDKEEDLGEVDELSQLSGDKKESSYEEPHSKIEDDAQMKLDVKEEPPYQNQQMQYNMRNNNVNEFQFLQHTRQAPCQIQKEYVAKNNNQNLQNFIEDMNIKILETIQSNLPNNQIQSQLFNQNPSLSISQGMLEEILQKVPAPPPIFRLESKVQTLFMTPLNEEGDIEYQKRAQQRSKTAQRMIMDLFGQVQYDYQDQEDKYDLDSCNQKDFKDQLKFLLKKNIMSKTKSKSVQQSNNSIIDNLHSDRNDYLHQSMLQAQQHRISMLTEASNMSIKEIEQIKQSNHTYRSINEYIKVDPIVQLFNSNFLKVNSQISHRQIINPESEADHLMQTFIEPEVHDEVQELSEAREGQYWEQDYSDAENEAEEFEDEQDHTMTEEGQEIYSNQEQHESASESSESHEDGRIEQESLQSEVSDEELSD